MAWYMEKGLNGFQTITDGCCFELNKVPYPHRYKVTSRKLMELNKSINNRKIAMRPLMRKKAVLQQEGDIITLNYTYKEIESQCSKHLRNLFPEAVVIKQFQLEIKEVVTDPITHGASNYQTRIFGKVSNTRMRSYKKKEYDRY